MLYTVNYTKTNNFMRQKGEPRLVHKNNEGEIVNETKYVKPSVSKAVRNYVPHIHYRKNTIQVALSQAELNKLVEQIGFYGEDGQVIKDAPLRNPNAPFWRHPDLKITLEGAGTTLNDDNPLDKFWLKCFEADPRFTFAGENVPPSAASRVLYTVTKTTENFDETSQAADETYEAMEKLIAMKDDIDKMVTILRAMGTSVKKPNPKLVRQALQRKITDYKDAFVKGTSERNIEMFMRMADGPTADLELKAMINEALAQDILFKKANGKYFYGDLTLGTSISAVEVFFKDEENIDIRNEIIKRLKE